MARGNLQPAKAEPFPEGLRETTIVSICGVRITPYTVDQLLDYIRYSVKTRKDQVVTYANVQTINLATKINWLQQFLVDNRSLVFCDGFGVLLGARLLGSRWRSDQRITGPDFLERLAAHLATKNISLYLLAGEPGIVDIAIAKLRAYAPLLEVDGHHGYFDKTGSENDEVLSRIRKMNPDILCIGLGSPLQEKWIIENRMHLDVRLYLVLGAVLDFYTESTWRGPRWLTDHGGEWVCRLFTEPRRLWKRYLLGIPHFVFRILIERFKRAE